jgi:hypothetical protein
MGDGLRPTGSFSYASLRYKEIQPACFKDKTKCPDLSLCDNCVHKNGCGLK